MTVPKYNTQTQIPSARNALLATGRSGTALDALRALAHIAAGDASAPLPTPSWGPDNNYVQGTGPSPLGLGPVPFPHTDGGEVEGVLVLPRRGGSHPPALLMPPHRWTTLDELEDLIGHNINLRPLGASQLGFNVRDRSVRTGSQSSPSIKAKDMPKRARSSKRSGTRSPARAFRRRRTTTRRRTKRISDIHTFKGIINAGCLLAPLAATSTHLGGQYIFKFSDLPIIAGGEPSGGGLGRNFDFVRLNKCRMEFLPRFNMAINSSVSNQGAPSNIDSGLTFMTAVDEVPLTAAGAFATAPAWRSQADEDSGVTECTAYDHPNISPSYLRGMPNVKETETYKKHVVPFYPVFFNQLIGNQGAGNTTGVYAKNIKKWVNLNVLLQQTGAEAQVNGPDYYGPTFCFSNNTDATVSAAPIYYDAKLHYSVSFRRLRGI